MTPFNLEKALAGAKVITRDGTEATQLVKFEIVCAQPVAAVVENDLLRFWEDGTFHIIDNVSCYDLFMAPDPDHQYPRIKNDIPS